MTYASLDIPVPIRSLKSSNEVQEQMWKMLIRSSLEQTSKQVLLLTHCAYGRVSLEGPPTSLWPFWVQKSHEQTGVKKCEWAAGFEDESNNGSSGRKNLKRCHDSGNVWMSETWFSFAEFGCNTILPWNGSQNWLYWPMRLLWWFKKPSNVRLNNHVCGELFSKLWKVCPYTMYTHAPHGHVCLCFCCRWNQRGWC